MNDPGKKDKNIPELLAPVGGWQQLKAAVQNGADAVYMGGSMFNARIKAENFTAEKMKEAIDYAHVRNVKVYITINTLIKDDELFRALSYVNDLYGMGADAVILQDLGLARLVRKYLPDMPMHLSTQGTVYNEEAADAVKELGFCRVVPARELTLEEIRAFTAECHTGSTPCEVEVFVHGALCMCYSGQCQMSRILGGVNGRSGNRGLCAQPCRLPYTDDSGNNVHLLSPKDICTLELIPQLCQAGVDSFKIEGRLKSPQYVAVVTSIYRKYLDQYRNMGYVKVQPSDMQRLTQIFNRGGFTEGYLFGNPGEALLSGDSPKNQGICVGSVCAVKKGSTLVDVRLENRTDAGTFSTAALSLGDGVEIRGSAEAGNVITYLKVLSDGLLRIGDIKERVKPGDKVYKVTDKALLFDAEKSYENDNARKVPVDIRFMAKPGAYPVLQLRERQDAGCRGSDREAGLVQELPWISVTGTRLVEPAVNKPLEEDRVTAQLAKLGDTVFEAADITVQLGENSSLPVSSINRMRREAAERVQALKCAVNRIILSPEELEDICQREALGAATDPKAAVTAKEGRRQRQNKHIVHLYNRDEALLLLRKEGTTKKQAAKRRTPVLCIPVELYMDDAFPGDLQEHYSKILPYILNVSKGTLDRYLRENFDAICEAVRDSGILIGNLGWIGRFRSAGIKIYGDYGLNVYNHQSKKALAEMGVEVLAWSHETETADFRNIPLMITEHPVRSKKMTDRKGKQYRILQSESGDKYLIFGMS